MLITRSCGRHTSCGSSRTWGRCRGPPAGCRAIPGRSWIKDINVSLFIGNGLFRVGEDGRKDRPEAILEDATPPFEFHTLQLSAQHRFGVVHLSSHEDIVRST